MAECTYFIGPRVCRLSLRSSAFDRLLRARPDLLYVPAHQLKSMLEPYVNPLAKAINRQKTLNAQTELYRQLGNQRNGGRLDSRAAKEVSEEDSDSN
jgi:hypothetical protein